MQIITPVKIFFCSALLLLSGYTLKAQPGAPDSTFGINGKVLSEAYEGSGYATVVQPDGKILVGGTGGYDGNYGFLVVRYNTDGTIDESFGDNGRALNDLGDPTVAKNIYKIALQPDGKIIAAGTYNAAIALIRYNTDGSIDTWFGRDGLVVYDLSTRLFHIMRDMALLPDGRIIVTGDLQANENDSKRSFIFSYTAAGTLDESFGDKGDVIISTPENLDINAIAITKDSKILVAGNYTVYRKTILYQYNTDGTPDISFGENGYSYMNFESDITSQEVVDMVLTSDNKIITVGFANTNSNNGYTSLITSRFLANGNPDSSYGANGYSLISLIKQSLYPQAAVINNQNNIVIAGAYSNGQVSYSTLMSLTEKGVADSSFGTYGIAYTDLVANLQDVAIQEDGKIVVAGYFLYQNYPDYRYYYVIGRFDGYDSIEKNKYLKIKKWLHRHGFTWEDWPGKKISYFAVQRSSNGNAFSDIARSFNRNNQQYSYEDLAPLNGSNYYRLAAVSADGSTAYSNIIAIDNNAVKLYPNPVRNTLQIEGLSATEKTKLTITDFMGNTKMSVQVTAKNYSWNVSQLKQGNYILKAETKGIAATKKFVKE